MSCIAYDRDGTELLGWNDGINGGVNVPLGTHVTCTATNETVPLTLVKEVDNRYGGTARPTDWTLYADGTGQSLEGVTGSPEVTGVQVDSGRYVLAERGPDGYDASGWSCGAEGEEPAPVADSAVDIAPGQDVTCTITNTHRKPGPKPTPDPSPGPHPPGPLPDTGLAGAWLGAGALLLVAAGAWLVFRVRRSARG